MNGWENVSAGVARGPLEVIDAGGAQVTVRPYWDDEDGVSVAVGGGGELVPASAMPALLERIGEVTNKAVETCKN